MIQSTKKQTYCMQYMNYLLALLEIKFLFKIGSLGGRGNIHIFTLELREKGVGTATVSLAIWLWECQVGVVVNPLLTSPN